jgi:tetratricopeptide (TPR) repeat protein
MRVCEGVQHAHQKAIIHRDLKPSNILVVEIDAKAAPKIIDFGVAKALTQKLSADAMFTRVGALVGTPEYMSPEQALTSGEDIDTRTDVYSLGIILYELLAGAPPIELRKIAFDEFLRRLREEDAQKPSTRIRTKDKATSADIARKRQTEPAPLARQLRGDLDSIALKALEKDRSRRYASPSEFAADIARYLRGEAVLAVPPSFSYRARKFGGRHWGGLLAAALALVGICGGVAVSIYQARIARERFQQVRTLANRFLQLHDDVARLPGSTKVREKMVATALDYLDNLARSAGKDADLLHEIGDAYGKVAQAEGAPGQPNLGRNDDALASYRKAIDFDRRAANLNPAYRERLADVETQFAYLAMLNGHLPEARSSLQSAASMLAQLRTEKREDLDVLSLAAKVALHQGDLIEYEGHRQDRLASWQQARQFTAEVARIKRDNASRANLHLITGLVALALADNHRYDEALAVLHEGEPLIDSLLAVEPDNPVYLRQKMSEANYIGTIYYDESGECLGLPAEAVVADRRYVALAERLAGADPNNASARLSLAIAYYRLSYPLGKSDPPESLHFAQKAIEIFDADLLRRPNDRLFRSRRARALRYLSYSLDFNHRRAEARKAIEEALAIQQQLAAASPPDVTEREQVGISLKVKAALAGR